MATRKLLTEEGLQSPCRTRFEHSANFSVEESRGANVDTELFLREGAKSGRESIGFDEARLGAFGRVDEERKLVEREVEPRGRGGV